MDFLEFIRVVLPYAIAIFLFVWFGAQIKSLIPRLSNLRTKNMEIYFDKEKSHVKAIADGRIDRFICKKCSLPAVLDKKCKCGEELTKENVIDLLIYIKAIHSIHKCICPICGNGILGETAHSCPSCGYGFGVKRIPLIGLLIDEVGFFCTVYILLGSVTATGLLVNFFDSYLDVSLGKGFLGFLFIAFILFAPLVFIALNLSKERRRQGNIYKIVKKMARQ